MSRGLIPYVVRPIDPLTPWPSRRAASDRIDSRFRASWDDTRSRIDREIFMLLAPSRWEWVLQVDVTESMINRDGSLSARARPESPAVRVAFESRNGPMLLASDKFRAWQDNVRAVALTLEALRDIERHGVAQSGQQYRGWLAIESAATNHRRVQQMGTGQAAQLIAHWAQCSPRDATLDPIPYHRLAIKAATASAESNGDETLALLNVARDVLLGRLNVQ